jgi:hypothetical protein
MTGMIVAGAAGLQRAPSEHFAGSLAAVSQPFRQLVTDLIDGRRVRPDGERLDISPRQQSARYVQLVVVEWLPGSERCFLIDLWARVDKGVDGEWDSRGTPRLPDDVMRQGRWEFFNCYVALRQWGRSAHLRGVYPKD